MIYFVQAGEGGPIKIGFAKTVAGIKRRLAGFQTCHAQDLSLLGYVEGTREDEAEFHVMFAADHVRGEWFHPTSALLDVAHHRHYARDRLDDFQSRNRWREWRMVDVSGALTDAGVEYLREVERCAAAEGWNLPALRDVIHVLMDEAA